jgi:hypothetical protein
MQNLHLPFGLLNEPLKFGTDAIYINNYKHGNGPKFCGYTVPNKF